MDKAQFDQLAEEGYNRIPVHREILADLDTPLSVYLKLASGPNSYLLESVQGGEKWGRYSIIGLPCRTLLRCMGMHVEILQDGAVVESAQHDDPLPFIEAFAQRYRVAELAHLPRFTGGLVGYFGYDTVRYAEPRLRATMPEDTIGTPDIQLMVSEDLIVFDNLLGKMLLISHADPGEDDALARAQARIDAWVEILRGEAPRPEPLAAEPGAAAPAPLQTELGEAAHAAAVERIKEYICAGDCMQVVLSQRMSTEFSERPIDLYRALRCLNPSPYLYHLDFGVFQVVGSSPEILVRIEDGEVTLRPIAGTRPRGRTEEEDQQFEKDLLNDPKELAEHLMLIDLGRNDVGRVSETGSVVVTDQMFIERYSHVMHIVSNVTGRLRGRLTPLAALRAALPAGTLSGAPKIRAMEIIDELDPVKRGIYGGAVGYLAWNGNMDTAIAIRTGIVKDGRLYTQAGGGIVADSVPRTEWEETLNKGGAMFRALEMVRGGLG